MRVAVFADVHANLAALEAVLEELARDRCAMVVCLGDIVGYNAEPLECLRLVRQHCDVCVIGNHDHDVLSRRSSNGTRMAASTVQQWTHQQLDEPSFSFLSGLKNHHVDPSGFTCAHGCYLNECFYYGYVTSTMLGANLNAIASHPAWAKIALCGHTHVPMAGWLVESAVVEAEPEATVVWSRQASAVLINPGSVGQPRDGDTRAAYAVVDLATRCVEFKRVSYDLERTVAAIRKHGLPEECAERLVAGR